ncbi:hypothetical protein ABN028_34115 [Actinopolymorpha sp. B17G11]|uniref:hypothetical protein n=1 Tax=Actinopolymorpha sp. B17G11 TaxID=3160861 RepID=UPI0032E379B1
MARNAHADFTFAVGTPQFDAVHTWAVVRKTLTMYEQLRGAPLPWAWNTDCNTSEITVFPHAGETPNAYYSRSEKALKFFHFTPDPQSSPIFTCRSFDIVAHEAGHAVLDGLKPGWLSADAAPQTGGLHEAFGDLTAIFLALSQLDQAEALITISKANLHERTFLSNLAEQFGVGLGMPFGLRNADNDLTLREVGNEVHAISQVFTGGIYDVLADIFAVEYDRQRISKDPALILVEVAHRLASLLLEGIIAAPATGATYADIINAMLTASMRRREPAVYRRYLRDRFALREVVVSPTSLADIIATGFAPADVPSVDAEDVASVERVDHTPSLRARQDRSTSCGTMQMPEYRVLSEGKLATGESVGDDGLLAADREKLAKAFA